MLTCIICTGTLIPLCFIYSTEHNTRSIKSKQVLFEFVSLKYLTCRLFSHSTRISFGSNGTNVTGSKAKYLTPLN